MKAYKEKLGALQQAVVNTVGNMAFMEMYLAREEFFQKAEQEKMLEASLRIFAPFEAVFHLKISLTLLGEMIENMYGIDKPDITEDLENEALGEILNAIAGQVVQSVPADTMENRAAERVEGAEQSVTCNFEYEGCGLSVVWEFPQ